MPTKDYVRFLRELLAHPKGVGAVAPSSERLGRRMVQWIDWGQVNSVVEWGPGTGVFTRLILESKRSSTKFIAIESSPVFAAFLQERFPTLTVANESVSNIQAVCRSQGVSEVDATICGLPWACFSDSLQRMYLEALVTVLRPEGQFATFAYVHGVFLPSAYRFRKKLREYFREVRYSRIVWLNLPPAIVYYCRR